MEQRKPRNSSTMPIPEGKQELDKHSSTPERPDSKELQEGKFHWVKIDRITADPKQARKFFNYESLEQLSQSITQKGMLQPVIIKKGSNGEFHLAAGERRLRAAKMAGLITIPALLTTGNALEISLIENLQRENLKPLEEAEALANMMKEFGYTLEQLGQVLNKAKSTLSETLSLNKLPDSVKEELWRTDIYPKRLLVEIAKQEVPEMMISLFSQVKNGNLKSGQVREITRRPANGAPGLKHDLLREISELANHLKKMDQQEVFLLADELKALKSLIEKLFQQEDVRRAEPSAAK